MTVLTFAAPTNAPRATPHPLKWDAMEKAIDVKAEDDTARFEFSVTNTGADPVHIMGVQPSCGCTVADVPATPWILAAGDKGSFSAVVDFRGKVGKFTKTLFVSSSAGGQTLTVTVNIPDTPEARRVRNQQMASLDRQAVFRGDCVACHVTPAIDKKGPELFQAACAICHLATPRAEMVSDLMAPREPRNAEYLQRWIADGKDGTLMPGFSRKHGGPLDDTQISSLVEFMLAHFPTEPRQN